MTDSGFHANLHQRVAIPACLQKAILCLFASFFYSSPASDGPNFRVLLYWMSNARYFGATYPAGARAAGATVRATVTFFWNCSVTRLCVPMERSRPAYSVASLARSAESDWMPSGWMEAPTKPVDGRCSQREQRGEGAPAGLIAINGLSALGFAKPANHPVRQKG